MCEVEGRGIDVVYCSCGLPVTNYFASVGAFKPMYIISGIWQNMGWDAILYIAALAGIDTTLYEAASIDGAGRLQKIWHISLPGISSTLTECLDALSELFMKGLCTIRIFWIPIMKVKYQ